MRGDADSEAFGPLTAGIDRKQKSPVTGTGLFVRLERRLRQESR